MSDQEKRETSKRIKKAANVKSVLFIVLVSVAVIAVAALLVVMGAKGKSAAPTVQSDETAATVAAAAESDTRAAATHSGFPLYFAGGGILDIKPVGSGLFVLTKDSLCFVSTSGAYRTPLVHTYVEPVLKTAGGFGLLFDRLSGRFTLADARKAPLSGQSENGQQINTAALNSHGDFVIAAKGGAYASLLTYYNKAGKILFSWECAKEHIVAAAISENRKQLLCAAVSADNGAMYTKLYLLDVREKQTVWETKLAGVSATACFFAGGHRVLAVFGDRRMLIDTKKQQDAEMTANYPAQALLCHSDEKGNTAVVTQKLGTFDTYEITVYDRGNRASNAAQLELRPISVFCRGKRAFVLTENGVYAAKPNGALSRVCKLDEIERSLIMVGTDAFHCNKNTLYKN